MYKAVDIANQSLNLTPSGRRLVPRYLPRSESDGKLGADLFPSDATMDLISLNGLSPRSMDDRRSRLYSTKARRRIGFRSMVNTRVQWMRGCSKSFVICFKMDIGFGKRMMVPRKGGSVAMFA